MSASNGWTQPDHVGANRAGRHIDCTVGSTAAKLAQDERLQKAEEERAENEEAIKAAAIKVIRPDVPISNVARARHTAS